MQKKYKNMNDKKSNNNNNNNNNNYTFSHKVILTALLVLVTSGWVLGIIGFGYGIYLKNNTDSNTSFKAKTSFDSPTLPENFEIPCGNKTLGNETNEFSEGTFLELACPKTENTCSEFICGIDGYCKEQTVSGEECYSNAQCGDSSRCDLNTCECLAINQCDTDSDCGIYAANPCLELKCISNECVTNLTDGANCSSNAQCGIGSVCNLDTCGCVTSIFNCTTSADCPIIADNPCQEASCVSGGCSYNLTVDAECSSSSNCNSGFSCNSTCFCAPNVGVQTYNPEFYDQDPLISAFNFSGGASFIYALFKDFGEFVEVQVEVEVGMNPINSTTSITFEFDLPILADTNENGAGILQIYTRSPNLDPTTAVFCSGYVFTQGSTRGRGFCSNSNTEYVGPNSLSNAADGFFSLTYKKA
jgi:hypothetical protein